MKALLNLAFYPIVFLVTLLVMMYKELAPDDGLTIKDAVNHAREIRDTVDDIKADINDETTTETPKGDSNA